MKFRGLRKNCSKRVVINRKLHEEPKKCRQPPRGDDYSSNDYHNDTNNGISDNGLSAVTTTDTNKAEGRLWRDEGRSWGKHATIKTIRKADPEQVLVQVLAPVLDRRRWHCRTAIGGHGIWTYAGDPAVHSH
jgi:hypothetical protein